MTMKKLISALTLTAALGTTLALPSTASAHEGGHDKRVKVIKIHERGGHDSRHQNRLDVDRWHLQRHREARSRWAPPHYGHQARSHERHASKHYRKHARHEHRHDHRRVEHRHYRNDAVQFHIGYDFWL